MKTTRIVSILAFVGLFSFAIPAADGRPVSDPNNPHNLSFGATHGRTKAKFDHEPGAKEICIFCHTPHSASKQGALWNRNDPALMDSFPLYDSGSLKIKNIAAAQYSTTADYPNGASKLCLSCHDGVTGIGTLLDRPLTMNHETMSDVTTTATFDPVIDLSQTHPVSFYYTTEVKDAINADGKTGFKLPTEPLRDSQERVQCTTCHNPHDDRSEVLYNSLPIPPFWRFADTTNDPYIKLCNQCHGTYDKLPGDHHTETFPRSK